MGYLSYDNRIKVEIEDRALAHLQIVIADKLRRGEPFAFTWRDDAATGHGRTAIWINPRSSLVFKYFGSRPPGINRAWLEALALAANAVGGLRLVREPEGSEEVEPTA